MQGSGAGAADQDLFSSHRAFISFQITKTPRVTLRVVEGAGGTVLKEMLSFG